MRALRASLPREFPGTEFYFLPDDIVSQILNFGLPAPIDVQVIGKNVDANRELADRMLDQMRRIPGIADLRIQQTFDQPKLHIFTRSHQSGGKRLHAGRRGAKPADLAQRQFPDAAHLLAEPAERRQLQRGHADAAVRYAIAAGSRAICR